MSEQAPKPVRCAVYTRKSTDENLELDFNSLDAHREAAELGQVSRKTRQGVRKLNCVNCGTP